MFARHARFLTAFGIGILITLACLVFAVSPVVTMLLAANGFFMAYLALMLRFAAHVSPADLRAHAARSDEGLPLIVTLALAAVGLSLSDIVLMLHGGGSGALETVLALASVPLGWAMVHVLAAFHYAFMYYAPEGSGDAEGMAFPGTAQPGASEFLYFAFVIGMTAQVSDVTVETTALRRVTLVHSVGSFFYNTVILALAVNAGVALGR